MGRWAVSPELACVMYDLETRGTRNQALASGLVLWRCRGMGVAVLTNAVLLTWMALGSAARAMGGACGYVTSPGLLLGTPYFGYYLRSSLSMPPRIPVALPKESLMHF